uniref:Uncharacterized protein n=1 Tax=viral metagenome TaxID=1070528 RepID=A0A6M3L5M3_9ZZZZ
MNSNDLSKVILFRKMIIKGFFDAGVFKAEDADHILEWAVGEDWKTLNPKEWPDRIGQKTGLLIQKEPVRKTIPCLVELYNRRLMIFTSNN